MIRHKEMLFSEFPQMGIITEEVKEKNKRRTFTGGIRIGSGMYRTDEQQRDYIRNSLKRKLP